MAPVIKALFLAALLAASPLAARADLITVFAASSLKPALDEIALAWTGQTGVDVALNYDGSARLAGQILQGAPADLFISAAPEWMDAAAPAMEGSSRRDLLAGDLVLIAHGQQPEQGIGPQIDLAALLGGGRLAIGQTETVPVGQYARQALQSLGLWDQVREGLAETGSAGAVLELVARGEAPLGVVFGSDLVAGLAAGLDISLIGRFPGESHAPIRYPAALVAGVGPDAAAFLEHLSGPKARAVFLRLGFAEVPQ